MIVDVREKATARVPSQPHVHPRLYYDTTGNRGVHSRGGGRGMMGGDPCGRLLSETLWRDSNTSGTRGTRATARVPTQPPPLQ